MGDAAHDIARDAEDKPLASDNDEEEEPMTGTEVETMVVDGKGEANRQENDIDLAGLAAKAQEQELRPIRQHSPKLADIPSISQPIPAQAVLPPILDQFGNINKLTAGATISQPTPAKEFRPVLPSILDQLGGIDKLTTDATISQPTQALLPLIPNFDAHSHLRPFQTNDPQEEVVKEEAITEKNGFDLAALAANALRQTAKGSSEPAQKKASAASSMPKLSTSCAGDPMEGLMPTISSISTLYVDKSGSQFSPGAAIKHQMSGSPAAGELPSIRRYSQQSALLNGDDARHITSASVSDQLGDINHSPEAAAAELPPKRPPPRFSAVPGERSPGTSPNEAFRRELPSSGKRHLDFNAESHPKLSQTDEPQYSSTGDDCGSNPETPITDQSGSTPAAMAIDRMSIAGITNTQISGIQCTYPGCTAQPFENQYLLNSHTYVHSSNRPHYCSVQGCPRGEGGKGFKRKNEMIRHGLVHDSPGYVCPFCPDGKHKYPRPDNLRRHVRGQHVDKDKDDSQLREVLSQRPEGPSRGRRWMKEASRKPRRI